ncbi:hypothetical protein BLA50215_02208 [Burkholderia lata]|uniref:hypothetical protein n=1 Tax=Burkholderia lata (strain ATCC 17760 / DSM 23089 / LMG 22485 / NCIMB 9086 / R18194 / 383) TaxID=482957 RepID=UPI00145393BC|nr:hypothetical protein [Burkholderia lata]VWC95539.1 hypothetical protein BLA50215_02208 [Burkholderia lata]
MIELSAAGYAAELKRFPMLHGCVHIGHLRKAAVVVQPETAPPRAFDAELPSAGCCADDGERRVPAGRGPIEQAVVRDIDIGGGIARQNV